VPEIQKADALASIFGGWPSFHDVEVISIRLTREDQEWGQGPLLEADIHLWETTSEVDDDGHYVWRRHTLATIGFSGVDELEMGDFNPQNVIFDLVIGASPAGSSKS